MASHDPAPEQSSSNVANISGSTTSTATHGSSKIRVELAVNINNQDDAELIDRVIRSKGINSVSTNLDENTVQIEIAQDVMRTGTSIGSLQRSIEEQTGFLAIIKGVGQLSSAVAELKPHDEHKQNRVMGVMRISQLEDGFCHFDGFFDGFVKSPGTSNNPNYAVALHEYGDLEAPNFASIGEPMLEIAKSSSDAIESGWSISKIQPKCDVPSMIGRSIAITRHSSSKEQSDKLIVSAGVVSRASTVGYNTKKICACSGKTLWEERVDKKDLIDQ